MRIAERNIRALCSTRSLSIVVRTREVFGNRASRFLATRCHVVRGLCVRDATHIASAALTGEQDLRHSRSPGLLVMGRFPGVP